MALAMRSTSAKAAGLYVSAASPWRRALWLGQDVPCAVRGPRLFRPLLRLASALAREIIAVARQVGRAALQLAWVGPRRRATRARWSFPRFGASAVRGRLCVLRSVRECYFVVLLPR